MLFRDKTGARFRTAILLLRSFPQEHCLLTEVGDGDFRSAENFIIPLFDSIVSSYRPSSFREVKSTAQRPHCGLTSGGLTSIGR
jgi:hypothetical protein